MNLENIAECFIILNILLKVLFEAFFYCLSHFEFIFGH